MDYDRIKQYEAIKQEEERAEKEVEKIVQKMNMFERLELGLQCGQRIVLKTLRLQALLLGEQETVKKLVLAERLAAGWADGDTQEISVEKIDGSIKGKGLCRILLRDDTAHDCEPRRMQIDFSKMLLINDGIQEDVESFIRRKLCTGQDTENMLKNLYTNISTEPASQDKQKTKLQQVYQKQLMNLEKIKKKRKEFENGLSLIEKIVMQNAAAGERINCPIGDCIIDAVNQNDFDVVKKLCVIGEAEIGKEKLLQAWQRKKEEEKYERQKDFEIEKQMDYMLQRTLPMTMPNTAYISKAKVRINQRQKTVALIFLSAEYSRVGGHLFITEELDFDKKEITCGIKYNNQDILQIEPVSFDEAIKSNIGQMLLAQTENRRSH